MLLQLNFIKQTTLICFLCLSFNFNIYLKAFDILDMNIICKYCFIPGFTNISFLCSYFLFAQCICLFCIMPQLYVRVCVDPAGITFLLPSPARWRHICSAAKRNAAQNYSNQSGPPPRSAVISFTVPLKSQFSWTDSPVCVSVCVSNLSVIFLALSTLVYQQLHSFQRANVCACVCKWKSFE